MTKRSPGADYESVPIPEWNVSHFHAWLIAETKSRFNVDYAPFGRGTLASRWLAEKGMLKQACATYGNEVMRRFIERCLESYRPTPQYPAINFGFMYSYRRDELQRAQADVVRTNADDRKTQIVDDDVDLSEFI
jgi:hypothetical protein